MAGNGKVFISHSHDDNARCAPLLAALDAWGVDYFFDTQGLGAGQQLNERIQQEITSRDIFLRICTAAVQRSFWMSLEVNAFRGLQAEDRKRGRGSRRVLINLILDGDYSREPFDNATLFIDGASRPRAIWLGELGRALGVQAPTKSAISRRTVLAYGAAGAVTLSSAAAAGALYLDYSSHASVAKSLATYVPGKTIWQIDHASAKKDIPPIPGVGPDGRVYVSNGFTLTSYDPAHLSGGKPRQLWQQAFTTQSVFSPPAVYGGTVYFTSDFTLYALKTSDGTKVWTARPPQSDNGNFLSTPLLVGGLIYILTDSGNLYALHANDGSVVWSAPVSPSLAGAVVASGPAVDGKGVYIGSVDHTFYAFDARSGSPLWKVPTRGKILSSPVVVNGVVYFGSGDNYVYALHAHDGSVAWKYLTGDDVQSTPSVTDSVVYIASNDGYLYTLDAVSGKPYWRAPIGDYDPLTKQVTNGGTVTCQPAITGDAVSVIDRNNWVVRSYYRHDGTSRWTHKSADDLQNSDPTADNGLILFGSGDQTLYAYGA